MSSLAGSSFCGTHDRTGARPRTTSGVTDPTPSLIPAPTIDPGLDLQNLSYAIQWWLFAGFGLFFEGVIGLSGDPFLLDSQVFPVVLIAAGGILVVLSLVRGRRSA